MHYKRLESGGIASLLVLAYFLSDKLLFLYLVVRMKSIKADGIPKNVHLHTNGLNFLVLKTRRKYRSSIFLH